MTKRYLVLAAVSSLVVSAGASGFQNGSFELGPAPGSFATLLGGNTSITGWTVGGHSIDYIGSYWVASNGSRSLDLGGNNNGSISQTFDTVANQWYSLSFDMSGNPDQGNPSGGFVMNVTAGNLNSNFTFTNPGTHSNMNWRTFTALFMATGTSTTLTFADIAPPGAYGPALDNVTLQSVPEPFSMSLSLAAVGLFVRRRLKSKKA